MIYYESIYNEQKEHLYINYVNTCLVIWYWKWV